MMNKNTILAFITGLTVGGGAAAIVTKTVMDKIEKEEIEQVRAYYKAKYESPEEDIVVVVDDAVEQANDIIEEPVESATDDKVKKNLNKPDIVNYASMYSAESAPAQFMSNSTIDIPPAKQYTPRLIDAEDYIYNPQNEQIELHYFPEEGVLSDGDFRVTDYLVSDIGQHNLDANNFEDGVVYIRDDVSMIDFTIYLEDGKLSDIVDPEDM